MKKNVKRIISGLVCMILCLFALTSCGGGGVTFDDFANGDNVDELISHIKDQGYYATTIKGEVFNGNYIDYDSGTKYTGGSCVILAKNPIYLDNVGYFFCFDSSEIAQSNYYYMQDYYQNSEKVPEYYEMIEHTGSVVYVGVREIFDAVITSEEIDLSNISFETILEFLEDADIETILYVIGELIEMFA